jgi:hypothetical protein
MRRGHLIKDWTTQEFWIKSWQQGKIFLFHQSVQSGPLQKTQRPTKLEIGSVSTGVKQFGREMKLNNYHHLVLRLRMSGSVTPFPHIPTQRDA